VILSAFSDSLASCRLQIFPYLLPSSGQDGFWLFCLSSNLIELLTNGPGNGLSVSHECLATHQSIVIWTLKTNPSSPSFTKGRNYPSLAKRGQGRFSETYVFFIMDSLVFLSWRQKNYSSVMTPSASSLVSPGVMGKCLAR